MKFGPFPWNRFSASGSLRRRFSGRWSGSCGYGKRLRLLPENGNSQRSSGRAWLCAGRSWLGCSKRGDRGCPGTAGGHVHGYASVVRRFLELLRLSLPRLPLRWYWSGGGHSVKGESGMGLAWLEISLKYAKNRSKDFLSDRAVNGYIPFTEPHSTTDCPSL